MRTAWTIAALALLVGLGGCVERKMTITSEPAGALVLVSDVPVGRTPVTVPFTWYGDYDIILRLDGHQTLKTHAEINPPIYEIPPLDLLSHMAPWTYRDNRYLHFTLEKLQLPPDEDLIRRADKMQVENLRSVR